MELFFDFRVMGTRHSDMQRMIRAALDRYRDAFRSLAEAVVDAVQTLVTDPLSIRLAAVRTVRA